MNFLKKLIVFIAASSLTFFLFLTVTFTTLAVVINPSNIKGWLDHSGVYYGAVDAILESTANAAQKNAEEGGDVFSSPDIKKAVKKSFPPSLLETSAENFIDGNFAWLEGKSEQPTFRIDLTEAKKNLAKNIVSFAVNRYKKLPVCKTLPPKETGLLEATCRVPGYDITADARKAEKELATSKELFGNPPIFTADSLAAKDAGKQSVYENLSYLPSLYKFLGVAPYLFGLLGIGALLILVFLSSDRRRGIRRASIALLVSAILLFIGALIVRWAIDNSSARLADAGNSATNFAQKTALSVGSDVGNQVIRINLYFGLAFAIIGGGLLATLLHHSRKQPAAKRSEEKTADDTGPAPDDSSPKPKN